MHLARFDFVTIMTDVIGAKTSNLAIFPTARLGISRSQSCDLKMPSLAIIIGKINIARGTRTSPRYNDCISVMG